MADERRRARDDRESVTALEVEAQLWLYLGSDFDRHVNLLYSICEQKEFSSVSSEMARCPNCGVYVPVEKAFCPNCSEPMEAEERPNRAHSFSSDNLMATMRDDPEKYRQMAMPPAKKQPGTPAESTKPPAPAPASTNPPVAGLNYPNAASIPPPPAKSGNKNSLIIGISAVVIVVLVLVLLFAFKII